MRKYIPQEFESKIIELWNKENTYRTLEPRKDHAKVYALSMFPYPSGAGLHVGHVRIYTGTDILARYFRMKGYAVMHPMGWDAFGLPAENAAIKAQKNPMDMVPDNIANFKRQMTSLGLSYDWSREFTTTDPSYYKWTQWLFIQFFKMGLLYKKSTPVYFCEFCKTGLAEEEVLPDGTHERCGKEITRKELPQWIFRITTYADRLLDDLKGLDWPTGILEMQKNWIGKKEGISIKYQILNTKFQIECFTTRPDTNFGATFIVVAPEHGFVKKIINGEIKIGGAKKKEIEAYVKKSLAKTDLERITEDRKKTGVFTGFYAINNLTGRKIPVWVSDFVLSDFGTGAVVGVPAHDSRDYQFAKEFGLPIEVVVLPDKNSEFKIQNAKLQFKIQNKWLEGAYEGEGVMVNSGFLNGLTKERAIKKIMDYLEEKEWGKRVVSYHLRDWIFSRQRYWGEPIPMLFCSDCAAKKITYWETEFGKESMSKLKSQIANEKVYQGISNRTKTTQNNLYGWFPIDQGNLPLKLPYLKSYEPSCTGESPLAKVKKWVETKCPVCGGVARRETDTMPNWAGSCWYFIRFAQIQNSKFKIQNSPSLESWESEMDIGKEWLPVDWYLGGAEHAVLHLLYSRFWVKALQDLKLLNFSEPFLRLRNVGMVLAEDHRKMSKSFGNVINPDDVVAEYGADTLRMYEMFMAPFNMEIAWSTAALQGAYRFLKRIWNLYMNLTFNVQRSTFEDKQLVVKLNKTIAKVTVDITEIKYNTAIAAMMEFLNEWEKAFNAQRSTLSVDNAKKFLQILAPFAPFATEEIWRTVFGEKSSIHVSKWPEVDKKALIEETVKIPVQINGKVRTVITISASDLSKNTVVKKALEDEAVKRYVEGKRHEVIYVKERIINFILEK